MNASTNEGIEWVKNIFSFAQSFDKSTTTVGDKKEFSLLSSTSVPNWIVMMHPETESRKYKDTLQSGSGLIFRISGVIIQLFRTPSGNSALCAKALNNVKNPIVGLLVLPKHITSSPIVIYNEKGDRIVFQKTTLGSNTNDSHNVHGHHHEQSVDKPPNSNEEKGAAMGRGRRERPLSKHVFYGLDPDKSHLSWGLCRLRTSGLRRGFLFGGTGIVPCQGEDKEAQGVNMYSVVDTGKVISTEEASKLRPPQWVSSRMGEIRAVVVSNYAMAFQSGSAPPQFVLPVRTSNAQDELQSAISISDKDACCVSWSKYAAKKKSQ